MEVLLRSVSVGAFLLFGLILFYSSTVYSCNEVVCASIVSKCMLISACKCELKNCSCCLDCIKCLGKKYYADCCSCVELCPKPNDTRSALSKKSNVEDFEGVPELFNVLVSEAPDYDWDTFTFQIDFDTLSRPKHINVFGNNDKDLEEIMKERDNTITVNCTVIYLDQCTSWNKCRQTCKSTGASSYRWFHDGCCECVGSTCINYGLNESRCRNCPEDETGPNGEDEEMWDYGDGVGPFDGAVNSNF